MRKLLLLALLLPLLCNATVWFMPVIKEKVEQKSGSFGYSYEEEKRPVSFVVTYGNAKPIAGEHKTVGIFKVYLDVDSLPYPEIFPSPFKYGGLKYKYNHGDGRVWVENVRELGEWHSPKMLTGRFGRETPTHTEAWEIRCKAIKEIERLKKKCECENWTEIPWYYKHCYLCGKELK